ncbi:acetyl-CoA hydrolase/transferase C-terminal domain-containing protein [Litoribrevibacter euphylliae]|uniref:Acetyl-CoA hydrolase/transferase C-terminal domain-containing protein n=1 Tax=Litoribrevibacter euphylliae TaxID=1834034 RepID=A0ABV7H6J5_9GAMM
MTKAHYSDVKDCVNDVIQQLNKNIVLGIPLGIGKPTQFINELYRRAKEDSSISLKIITALSLERPKPAPGLEAKFLEPVFDRLFDGYVGPDYVADLKKQQIPDNVQLCEFFFKSGSMINNDYAQQHYILSNYTHVARDMIDHGANLLAQQVCRGNYDGQDYLSLSSNTDVTVDLMPLIQQERAKGKTIKIVAQINQKMPFMLNDALVNEDDFDMVIDNSDYYTTLFAPPNMPVTPVDFAIGMHASALVKDGGTLQIGIGSLGDAIVYACQLKNSENAVYKEALAKLGAKNYQALIDKIGDTEPFKEGLYGSSEMFVNGFLHLIKNGIVKRKVYDDLHIQRLINDGKIKEELTPECLDELIKAGFFGDLFHEEQVLKAKHFGIFNERVSWKHGQIYLDNRTLGDSPHEHEVVDKLKSCGIGKKLKHGIIMHGGFFLGPKDFYDALHKMTIDELEAIGMTSVGHVNQLLINEDLVIAQRKEARFINTGLMATLNGAVVSDGLENGKIVSGVGGQYNFVSMAHALPCARSILLIRSTRESQGKVSSNVVWNYGHTTIPRHLRDIVITEYGVADLRGKTDVEVMKAMLNVTDSRFQQELLDQAKQVGKIEASYEIPEAYRQNTPEFVANTIEHYRQQGFFSAFPLGTDFTEQELQIGACLKQLKALQTHKMDLMKTLFKAFTHHHQEESVQPFLERMAMTETKNQKEKIEQKLLIHQLHELGVIS